MKINWYQSKRVAERTTFLSYAGDIQAKKQPVEHHNPKLSTKGYLEFYLFVNLKSVVDIEQDTTVNDDDVVALFSTLDDQESDSDGETERLKRENEEMKRRLLCLSGMDPKKHSSGVSLKNQFHLLTMNSPFVVIHHYLFLLQKIRFFMIAEREQNNSLK